MADADAHVRSLVFRLGVLHNFSAPLSIKDRDQAIMSEAHNNTGTCIKNRDYLFQLQHPDTQASPISCSNPSHPSQETMIGRFGRRLDTGFSLLFGPFFTDIPDTDAAAEALGTPPAPPPLCRTDLMLFATLNMEAESDTSSPASIAVPNNASQLSENFNQQFAITLSPRMNR